jgi:DNA-directed RNA polymerase subunit RPC12/RpoP
VTEGVTGQSFGDQAEVVCPHCKKTFVAELIEGSAERYRGFKCPHCKLFVPQARTENDEL